MFGESAEMLLSPITQGSEENYFDSQLMSDTGYFAS